MIKKLLFSGQEEYYVLLEGQTVRLMRGDELLSTNTYPYLTPEPLYQQFAQHASYVEVPYYGTALEVSEGL